MKKKILLADDDDSVRTMIGRVLESAGYVVTQASSTEQAAAEFCAARPDLVVWDLEMPAVGGPRALELEGPAGSGVPVVAMTAWPAPNLKSVPQGVAALVEKPLDLSLLLKTIQDLLQTREPNGVSRLAPAA